MGNPEPDIALSEPSADEIKTTTCYMCACRCGIRVHLKDGRVRYIDGNRDHPVNRGVICGKGASGIMTHTSPSRLRAPLKRVGPRGSGEFEEISWDEALANRDRLAQARCASAIPSQLAFFTGRDQSQALTGWFAQQYGTHELRRARRLLLGQHGGGRALHVRRLVLGVRRAGLGAHPLLHAVRRRRGSRLQSAQDRARQAQGQGRQGRRRQSDPHRLWRDRRRMDRHPARHRRLVRRRADPRADAGPEDRSRLSGALHQRALAGDRRPAARPTTACSRATPTASRSPSTRPRRARRCDAHRHRAGAGRNLQAAGRPQRAAEPSR